TLLRHRHPTHSPRKRVAARAPARPHHGAGMKTLVTGAAGFIGAHTTLRLLQEGHEVVGLDNFNDYYDPQLKEARVRWVRETAGDFPLYRIDLEDEYGLEQLFAAHRPEAVINLAAQAGVRYSLDN